jgi:3-oxoacyl-[acyl-carrier protein] reductase
VTGAGAGIGKAIASTLAANGALVIVNDLKDHGEQTTQEISQSTSRAIFIAADVTQSDEVDRMIASAEREFGKIDILVNNAGINTPLERRHLIHEFDVVEWHRVIDVDLHGLFHCCRATTPGMVQRKSGTIINISSVLGMVPIRLQSPYAAAKAAVINFSRSIALELAPFGIRVNVIAPGSILTEGTAAAFYNPEAQKLSDTMLNIIPMGRPGKPEEVADAALFLVSSASAYITGTVLTVDGGWTAGFAREW